MRRSVCFLMSFGLFSSNNPMEYIMRLNAIINVHKHLHTACDFLTGGPEQRRRKVSCGGIL